MVPFTVLQLDSPPSTAQRHLGFALGGLVGDFGLFVSSRFLAVVQGYEHAVRTMVIGALA